MPAKSPQKELAEIRDLQRRLRRREAELLVSLRHMAREVPDPALAPRPGWPMQRLTAACGA